MDLHRNLAQRINVGDALTRTAATRPDQLAVVDGDRRWTYAQFNAWVNRLAHGLTGRGYVHGDALALASGNSASSWRLLRLRQTRRRVRADQPGLAGRRGRLCARPFRARGIVVEPSSCPHDRGDREGGHAHRRDRGAGTSAPRTPPSRAERAWLTTGKLEHRTTPSPAARR